MAMVKKHKQNISEILNDPVDNNKEGAALSKLWRIIVSDLNLGKRMEFLISNYIQNSKNSAIKHKTKSSMRKNITDDNITWKTFLDILFNVVDIEFMTVTVTLHHKGKSKSIHTIDIVAEPEKENNDG